MRSLWWASETERMMESSDGVDYSGAAATLGKTTRGSMSEIQEYIDHPNETLHAEYKRWLDLSIPESRANLARHIAAIANHGGGYIIFGFEDDTLASSGPNPFSADYNRDGIASITRKYLDPAVHCDVREFSDGTDSHAVIVVPSHGAIPICAKANGPTVDGGKPKGITAGAYYIRKVGPESAPITSSADWYDLIRRCVMHDRTAILGALGAALVPQRERKADVDRLLLWHNAAFAAYKSSVVERNLSTDLYETTSQYSYLVETSDHERLAKGSMKEILRQGNAEMRDRVNTGWSLFFPFDRKPIDPYFITDSSTGDADQFLEANLVRDYKGGPNADFWRVSDDGRATTIRPLRSDFHEFRDWQERKYFSPNNAARELGELVRHAEALSSRYRSPQTVSFLCEWRGLSGRMIADPNVDWSPGRIARANNVVSQGTWSVAELTSDWPTIVSELLAPLLRAFDANFTLSADWVRHAAASWRPIGDHYP